MLRQRVGHCFLHIRGSSASNYVIYLGYGNLKPNTNPH